jgi:hypothetical protein
MKLILKKVSRRTDGMDSSNSNMVANLESAFAGESMANRKYLFFAEVVSKLVKSIR